MSPPSQPRTQRLVVENNGEVSIVGFVDRRILDEANIQIIADQLFGLVDDQRRRKIILNFVNVEYLSSAALGKLITLHKKLVSVQGKLVLCNISPQIFEVFAITKLDKIFVIKKELPDALGFFGVTV